MCSNILDLVQERVKSFLADFCPCLVPSSRKSHGLDEVRKSKTRNFANENQDDTSSKIFTIETIKRKAAVKKDSRESAETDMIVEKCPWDTESSDFLLKVGKSVFPVHQFLLSIESEILRTIIESVPAVRNATTVVTLNGYEADEIKTLLTLVYLPETEIDDDNIHILLKLADELMIEELVIRCEDYLLTSQQSPISLLNLAFKYQLPSLEESAVIEASKICGIEKAKDFKTLSLKQRGKVLNMSENRFRSGSNGAMFTNGRKANFSQETFELETKSPEMKIQRRLSEHTNKFQGNLSFLPENDTSETAYKETKT